ncbi:MAG TPA: thioredoxin domain-containing protein [Ktedonobacterales bacterium]|nr:thioredoxin domain-containing protein [Ktedonobacterales bacterium]
MSDSQTTPEQPEQSGASTEPAITGANETAETPETADDARETGQTHVNRLISESSPYLLQHAHNPVDWYPWGEEAFEKARAKDRPVLLSIGYSACHWCHVMEKESFENEATARLMNSLYVNIKVDREERPDLDALYMDAVQALTGNGGWPMTVFLTPDGAPFYAGTYFPPEDRYGMPGFPTVLRRLAYYYTAERNEVEQQATAFRDFYRERDQNRLRLPDGVLPSEVTIGEGDLKRATARLLELADTEHGGFGGPPKFPHSMNLEYLLRQASRQSGDQAALILAPVRQTLDIMAAGGIYDQVGGGFHRYATDAIWLVPHFEKMLYDNALLARVYLHAWQLTGEASYRRICEETLDYVLREMTDKAGGFYSTQDADSEGAEGKFYVWTPGELRDVLGATDAQIVEKLWGVTETGNFEGHTILHIAQTPAQVAAALGMEESQVHEAIARARAKLYEARSQRVAPARDDKVLTAWNSLMQRTFAEAGRCLNRADYRDAAAVNARFLLATMRKDNGLLRSWRNGQGRIPGYLEDYAALANALLATYEATGDAAFFVQARALVDEALNRFWDHEIETFFDTAADHEQLIGRPRELTDNATPSGMSLMAEALLRLAAYTGEQRYREYAARVLAPLTPAMIEQPLAFGHLLCALDDFVGPLDEVAIIGKTNHEATQTLLNVLRGLYRPRMVLAQAAPEDASAQATVPLLTNRPLVDNHPTAYLCRGFVCKQPVNQPDELLLQLTTSG